MRCSLAISTGIVFATLLTNVFGEELVVNTEDGSVEGIWEYSPNGTPVRVFYGIPYAIPPLGHRRYRAPEPAEPWQGVLDGTKLKAACMQKRIALLKTNGFFDGMLGVGKEEISEDCLTLNVFVPKNVSPQSAVMVWIHGGGFALGSAAAPICNGTTLAGEENVVVVTMNYRLASFGNLYLGVDGAPGNVALMDQALALKWIQRHISVFNGDPDKVTLFGQSSGSSNIGYHLLLESSQNLFKRAILQSGSPTAPFAYRTTEQQLKITEEFASNLECPFVRKNLTKTLECFLGKTAKTLIENEPQLGYGFVYLYTPVPDGKYIKTHPLKQLRKTKTLPEKQIMSGTTRDEATVFLSSLYPFSFAFVDDIKPGKEDLYEVQSGLLGLDKLTSDVTYTLYKNYPIKLNDSNMASMAIRIGTESLFYCPLLEFEEHLLRQGNQVYKFIFEEQMRAYNLPKWFGAFHGSDVLYAFGDPLRKPSAHSSKDRTLSKRVMRYWANFARTGNPNVGSNMDEMNMYWPETTLQEPRHMSFKANSISIGSQIEGRSCKYWTDVVPKIVKNESIGVFSFVRPE